MSALLSKSEPNGCGAEGSMLNTVISNRPFLDACNNHDICYESGSSKSFCDEAFLFEMKEIIKGIIDNLNTNIIVKLNPILVNIIIKYRLDKLAELYYAGVRDFGGTAFCNVTPSDDCFPEVPENATFHGYFTQEGDSTSLFRIATCEVWKFPNGRGGYYHLNLNCIFVP